MIIRFPYIESPSTDQILQGALLWGNPQLQAFDKSFKNPGHPTPTAKDVFAQTTYGGFQKLGYPQIIHVNRIFHYKPSFWGTTILGNTHMNFYCFCLGASFSQMFFWSKHHKLFLQWHLAGHGKRLKRHANCWEETLGRARSIEEFCSEVGVYIRMSCMYIYIY